MAVMLTSLELTSRTELTFTENISSGGARVVTGKLWSADDVLVIKSMEGDLQSEARVVYRQPVREQVYAIGVKFIEPKGGWQTKSGSDLLVELLEAIARNLVEHPVEVHVRAVQGQAITVLEVRVHPADIGKVIGHDGRVAEALRTILGAAGRKLNRRVKVEILD